MISPKLPRGGAACPEPKASLHLSRGVETRMASATYSFRIQPNTHARRTRTDAHEASEPSCPRAVEGHSLESADQALEAALAQDPPAHPEDSPNVTDGWECRLIMAASGQR